MIQYPVTHTWLQGIGNCLSVSYDFRSKPERDYFASKVYTIEGYIKHSKWEVKNKIDGKMSYFVSVWVKEIENVNL